RTVSCCQLESPAMRNLLSMLQPDSVRGLMQALALIRPAPASCGMKEEFVLRTQGERDISFEHPLLQDVLGDTRGILLFEDDAMRVASALAGVSLEEGDLLRRAISKGDSEEELRRVSRSFIEKAVQNGVSAETASRVWARMAQFNNYSFCRAHAASYAIMAYQLAYLKAHHPAEFMTAVLNHHWGMYPRRAHLEEARRTGVDIRGPHINRSKKGFSLQDGRIRVGLEQVKELTRETLKRALRLRQSEPFGSLPDFLRRTGAGRRETENLVLAGAFDFTGLNRPQLLWQLETAQRGNTGEEDALLFPNRREEPEPPALTGYSPVRRMRYEMSVLELSVAAHPMQVLRPRMEGPPLPRSDALPELVGQKICTAGILSATRTTTTRHGGAMQFLTLEDEKGLFEVTLFPNSYRGNAGRIEGMGPYVVQGTVEDQHGAISLNAASVRPLGLPEKSRQETG
ncbi:MAG: OB-fold nucleic acid binding domain-containing protein, partial [Planctomycetota bacterium]